MSCARETRYRFAMGVVGRWPLQHLSDFDRLVEGPRPVKSSELSAGRISCDPEIPPGLRGSIDRLAVAIVDCDGWIVIRRGLLTVEIDAQLESH